LTLKQQAISGVKWTSLSSMIIVLVQLAQLAILAHYLAPQDFGLMAIVGVVIGFSALFMDMGISASIIQKQDITHLQLSSLYWLNIIAGIFIFIIIYNLAPIVSNFYNEVELIPIVRLLALTFIITAVGNQHAILLQKKLRFDAIAKINVLSVITGFTAAVVLAIKGYGVYALVYASLVSTLVGTSINVIIGLKEHRPSLIYSHNQIRAMISFGFFQMGERGLNYFNSQFDVILIGKLLGTEALGIYSIAKNISMRPAQIINPIITTVTFPVMAKVQDDTAKLKAIYLKTINYLSSVNFPIYILLALLAEPVVLVLFGEKWVESILVLQILSIYSAVRSTGNPIGSLLLSKGRADLGFYWNIGLFSFMPLVIYLGSYGGLDGVAYSLLGLMVFSSVPAWYFLVNSLCGASFVEYFWQILQPLVLAITGGLLAYWFSLQLMMDNIVLYMSLTFVVMGLAMLILNILFNREFVNTLVELLKKGERDDS
jgi:O-antigen/teichoic acid export membrane protein